MESDLYAKRGVSSSKSEVHHAIENMDPGIFPGAFCKILPNVFSQDSESCLLMHADGAGTKAALAYIYWKETGDLNVFKDLAMDSLVMNLDDLACVGAVDQLVLSNTIGRNKIRIPGEIVKTLIQGYEESISLLASLGITIQMAGGETADVGDLVRTLIIDSTLVSRMKRSKVIDFSKVVPDDVIVGFSSFGRSRWESKYNSGIGSNGLTSARHDLFHTDYSEKYPESYAPEIQKGFVYCGPFKITDPLEGTPLNMGQAVLSPTRTYAPLIKEVLSQFGDQIHGLVHCSGGGQTKCVNFGRQIHYIKDNLLDPPPLFRVIQKVSGRKWKDLIPIYNLGSRLEMYVPENIMYKIIQIAKAMSIDAQRIGYCKKGSNNSNQLSIFFQGEEIQYD